MEPIYTDEKIDYTEFLGRKPQETDPAKLAAMNDAVSKALTDRGVCGHISCEYYKDGHVLVYIDGKYYTVFDSKTGKFFSGFVGN